MKIRSDTQKHFVSIVLSGVLFSLVLFFFLLLDSVLYANTQNPFEDSEHLKLFILMHQSS